CSQRNTDRHGNTMQLCKMRVKFTFARCSLHGKNYISVRQALTKQIRKPMETIQFHLKSEHIALCDLLKLTGIADSGGRGKAMVAEGLVNVDGQVENRKTAKIRAGQLVECMGSRIEVTAA